LSAATGEILEQRDRFLAFAFAASDLLMEVDAEGRISFASGAVKNLTGLSDETICKRIWTDLFIETDRLLLKETVKNAPAGKRCGPLLVTLQDRTTKKTVGALFTAIKMPGRKSVYVTLAYPTAMMRLQGTEQRKQEKEDALINKDEFIRVAQSAIKTASEAGKEVGMTLLEMPDLQSMKSRVSKDHWEETLGLMANLLKSRSIDGQAATRISESHYGLLHDKSIQSDTIREQVSDLLKEADPEGRSAGVVSTAVTADMSTLNEKEVSRALMYTLNSFEKNGSKLTIQSLNEGLKGFLNENTKKIERFKQMTVRLDFYLQFQPIVSLTNLALSHYEILSRFRDGSSPYEWITFGEEVGLAAEFDMAVCTQSVRYMSTLPRDSTSKFAINISGQSIESEQFVDQLRGRIRGNKSLPGKLIFEITESANIKDLEKVNNVIGMLQKDGFGVCLDDFGAGSASFQYLHKLHVDYVKLDGAYVQQILGNKRDETMVRNLAQLCSDLKVGMVAEHIETEEEAVLLRNMKVGYGQGFWFSKPMPNPEYVADEAKLKRLLAAPLA
jgi:EAL domain-containing protein (putative c-di-GMP-specific phosphodiesterase class I)